MDAPPKKSAVQLKDHLAVADDPGLKVDGLVECQEMDKQLAQVASLRLTDIHAELLDEIFQCVDFVKLLVVRRVCLNWNMAISRESAPFLRQVALAVETMRPLGSMAYNYNMWQHAKSVTTVVMFGMTGIMQLPKDVAARPAQLWDLYRVQVARENRTQLANKVIYANITVYSKIFHHSATQRAGFETALYRSFLKVKVAEAFPYPCASDLGLLNDYEKNDMDLGNWPVFRWFKWSGRTLIEIPGKESFVLTETDVDLLNGNAYWVNQKRVISNPAVPPLFARNARPLDAQQMEQLVKNATAFGDPHKLSVLVTLIIQRFDPGNKGAQDKFLSGQIAEFAKLARPLVSVLLYYFIVDVDAQDNDGEMYSSDDEEDSDDNFNYAYGYDYDSDF